MKKDNIFADKSDPVTPFEFNEEVASVFDDMIKRSVPLYMESIRRQSVLARQFYRSGSSIYDLGCSHGNLGIMILDHFKDTPFKMVAVDSSRAMIERYARRLEAVDALSVRDAGIELVCDHAEDIRITNASVVIVNLTMQFIHPEKRDNFVKGIYDGLIEGGILLLSEKIVHKDTFISTVQQNIYRDFKKENGYSDLEISRKREALENVLIPETVECHMERLEKAGFKTADIWLKWFNFASIMAIK